MYGHLLLVFFPIPSLKLNYLVHSHTNSFFGQIPFHKIVSAQLPPYRLYWEPHGLVLAGRARAYCSKCSCVKEFPKAHVNALEFSKDGQRTGFSRKGVGWLGRLNKITFRYSCSYTVCYCWLPEVKMVWQRLTVITSGVKLMKTFYIHLSTIDKLLKRLVQLAHIKGDLLRSSGKHTSNFPVHVMEASQ